MNFGVPPRNGRTTPRGTSFLLVDSMRSAALCQSPVPVNGGTGTMSDDRPYDLLRDVERLWIEGCDPNFPFEKEVTLFRFRVWVLVPVFGPTAGRAARFIARIVTMHRCNSRGEVTSGQIRTLDDYRKRLNEDWFGKYYQSSFFHERVGNLRSVFTTSNPGEAVERRRAAMGMSIDMLDFLLRATKYHPKFATRKYAKTFISHNGFNRADNYEVRIGEKKRARVEKTNQPIRPITVEKHWDSSPPTLGLAYLMAKTFSELDSLNVSDEHTLLTLVRLANNANDIQQLLGHYKWLLDFCTNHLRNFGKHDSWPRLTCAIDPIGLALDPLTAEQLRILETEELRILEKAPEKQA